MAKTSSKKATAIKPAKTAAIGLRVDERLRGYLERRAARENRSLSNLVAHLLQQIAEDDKWR